MSRETSKVVEIQGRKFEIKKFDAFTGGYIIFQLFENDGIIPVAVQILIINGIIQKCVRSGF